MGAPAQSKISLGLSWGRGGGPGWLEIPDSPSGQSSPGQRVGVVSEARVRGLGLSVGSLRGAGGRLSAAGWGVGAPSFPISGPPPTPTPPLWRSWKAPRLDSGTNFPAERGLSAGERGRGPSAGMGAVGPGWGPRRPEAEQTALGPRTPRVSAPPAGTQGGLAL